MTLNLFLGRDFRRRMPYCFSSKLYHTILLEKRQYMPIFLNLSRALYFVLYDIFRSKLREDTTFPPEITLIFSYWYCNQRNSERWAGANSDVYGLGRGVGRVELYRLFNLHLNRLISEFGNTNIRCYIDAVCKENVSDADDMELLSPSSQLALLGGLWRSVRRLRWHMGSIIMSKKKWADM